MYSKHKCLKGTVSRDFLLLVFFMNQFPPSPEYSIKTVLNFFENSVLIIAFAQRKVPPRTRSYKKDDEPLLNLPGAMSHCSREKVLMCTQKRELEFPLPFFRMKWLYDYGFSQGARPRYEQRKRTSRQAWQTR